MNDEEESLWVRRALPKAVAEIGTAASAKALLESLENADDAFHRRKLVEALGSMREHRHQLARQTDRIAPQIREEARCYLSNVAKLVALGFHRKGRFAGLTVEWDGELVPTLLDQLVEQRASQNLHNLFGLVALVYGPDRIWPAYISLTSDLPILRARALEFLDNTLDGDIKKTVFAVIDDSPLAVRLELAQRHFDIGMVSKAETLLSFLRSEQEGDTDESALAVLALYAIHQEREPHLEGAIADLQSAAADPFVQETADWVAGRMGIANG